MSAATGASPGEAEDVVAQPAKAEPLFERDGGTFLPGPWAVGPWDPGALHGGAAAAAMVVALEEVEPDPELPFARLTFEFTRPVPLGPLEIGARLVRPGKRVQLLEAEVRAGAEVVARATGLRVRAGDSEVPPEGVPRPAPPPAPGDGRPPAMIERWGHGLIRWMDLRVVAGEILEPGPAAVWFRAPAPFVAGTPPTPAQRVVAAADFGNGISSVLDFRTHVYINPDLTIYLHRYPRGEWVGLEGQTWVHDHGVGLAESLLWDGEGPIGRSLQALLVGKRA